jgi:ribosomal protein S18 acetylase RimI-like enzyme
VFWIYVCKIAIVLRKTMIAVLNHRDRSVAEEIDRVQKEAYKIEADLIRYNFIPYLHQKETHLQESGEIFIGFIEEKELKGVLSYEKPDRGVFDICRLAIKPGYFRRGIGEALVREVEVIEKDWRQIFVQTAKDNLPALSLYAKSGYGIFKEFDTPDGLRIIRMVKRAVS